MLEMLISGVSGMRQTLETGWARQIYFWRRVQLPLKIMGPAQQTGSPFEFYSLTWSALPLTLILTLI